MIYQYRGYDIKAHKEHSKHYIVVTSGKGGKIPDVLTGLFTSVGVAKGVIDKYLDNKKVKDNAEAVD